MTRFLSILLLIGFLFTACSSNKDNDLYNSASENYKANKFSEAAADYQKIISDYPNSKHVEESYFAVSAIYQMLKIPNISREESLKKAVQYLREFYEKFPNAKKTPKALFMVGFIEANDLKDYDAAKKDYGEFLKKYPKNELVESVKMELANLGKTPDEIIGQGKSAVK